MSQPTSTYAYVSNMFIKLIRLDNIGDVEVTHLHEFDHVTLLSSGSVLCSAGAVHGDTITDSKEFTAPHLIYIKENTPHRFEATSPNTVLACLHAIKNENGKVLDPSDFPEDSLPHQHMVPFIREKV